MRPITRRQAIIAGISAIAAGGGYWLARDREVPLGFAVSETELLEARVFLKEHLAVDAHAHPGRTFVRDAAHLPWKLRLYSLGGSFEAASVAAMTDGGLAGAAFAAVSDFQTLDLRSNGLASIREFEAGEAWASYRHQVANLKGLAADGLVYPVLKSGDFSAARRTGKIGALLTVEGGDFLEGDPARVASAFRDGIRSITLMHYRINELGDIITAPARHGGLSKAGAAVVEAMNASGILIDVAHASEATARGAVGASKSPVMASHVHVGSAALDHPRFISGGLAKSVADSGGGVLGAWPAGIGIEDLNGFVLRTLELVRLVGVEHVCLGSDMDANYKPVFDDYRRLPHYVAGLFQKGMQPEMVAKLVGGNLIRILDAVEGS